MPDGQCQGGGTMGITAIVLNWRNSTWTHRHHGQRPRWMDYHSSGLKHGRLGKKDFCLKIQSKIILLASWKGETKKNDAEWSEWIDVRVIIPVKYDRAHTTRTQINKQRKSNLSGPDESILDCSQKLDLQDRSECDACHLLASRLLTMGRLPVKNRTTGSPPC